MSIFRACGIRGIYGKDLTDVIMTRIGEAAGTCSAGAFTIGRDFREHPKATYEDEKSSVQNMKIMEGCQWFGLALERSNDR